jgi:hypothetical protein
MDNFTSLKMSEKTSTVIQCERQLIAEKLITKYPNKIPVILKHQQNKLNRTKYIVPADITIGKMINHVRKMNPSLKSSESLFFFIDNILLSGNSSLSSLYQKHKSHDCFLYIICATENTFG